MRDQESSPSVAFHPTAGRRAVLFGPFRFDLSDKTLTRDGEEIRLPPRALLILAYLLERPNRVVGKQDLIDAVWKEAFVGESSLTEAMGVLRQALGDSASDPGYIQTVHRRGYRFVAPLRVEAQAASTLAPAVSTEAQTADAAPSGAQPKAVPWFAIPASAIVAAVAALVALGGAGVWLARRSEPVTQVTRADRDAPSRSVTRTWPDRTTRRRPVSGRTTDCLCRGCARQLPAVPSRDRSVRRDPHPRH